MISKPTKTELMLALLWEGERPIPYHFDMPLRRALKETIIELYKNQHPEDKEPIQAYGLVSKYQPPELGELLNKIVYFERTYFNPWEYFDAARGSWWMPKVPLKPISEHYFEELKTQMRQHFGDLYETLAQHFVPHFQRLAADYR